jgi:phospholipase/carboxylesterase
MSHQRTNTLIAGKDLSEATSAMILIHGRGATASSIMPLTYELGVPEQMALLAPEATANSWYPYSFMAPVEANQPNLDSALSLINELVEEVISMGISSENIYFLGFSQGACLTAEYIARNAKKYGGAFIYSGGLIGEKLDLAKYHNSFAGTPIVIGCSDIDAHIPLKRVQETSAQLREMGAVVDEQIYPNAPHTVFADEISRSKAILEGKRFTT